MSKAPGPQKAKMQFTKVNGVKLSIRERNERMKGEYIRGASVEELAQKYHLGVTTINDIRQKNKWVAAKKSYDQTVKSTGNKLTAQVYAGYKKQINLKYHEVWGKLMSIVEMCLDDPAKYLMYEDGGIRWGALSVVAELIEKAQNGQSAANGNMSAETAAKLEMERLKLDQMLLEGEADEGTLDDNFMDAINQAAKIVYHDFQKEA